MDSELPNKMAHLEKIEVDQSVLEATKNEERTLASTSRVLGKRKPSTAGSNKHSNLRVSMKPRKRATRQDVISKRIDALFLNKKINKLSQPLETIDEEPKANSSGIEASITFPLGSNYTKEKIEGRRAKIKKLLGNKTFLNRKKIPMQEFLKKMECLDSDEVVHTECKSIEGA